MATSKQGLAHFQSSPKSRNGIPHRIGRNRPIPAKRAITVPPPQVARILARHFAGQSIRGISRAENRDRETVAKVLRSHSGEVNEYVTDINQQIRELSTAALTSLARGLASSGWLALRYLEAVGVFPIPREGRPAVVQEPAEPTPAEVRQEKLRAHFKKFAEEAYERSRAFDARITDIEPDHSARKGKLD